jgi:Starch-binding associating with outer membrane
MRKILVCFLITLLIAESGCKKGFLDINKNPNSPTDESITPDLIISRALAGTASRMATSYNNYAGWLGYWARSGTYGPNTEEESYHITTTFEADEWSGWYNTLYDFDVMEKKANANGQKFYEGIAKIMKTIGFMYLVDQYNNVPYSKAFDLGGNILPAYDKGPDIYADLFVQLDKAVALITAAVVSGNNRITEADIMFNGSKTLWLKLANTQRLKLILRLSQVTTFTPATQIAKITADGFLGAGQTASVQPGYVADNNKQNPFWNTFEKLYTGADADFFNRANNYVLNTYKNNNDLRYTRVFNPVQAACAACNPPVTAGSYYGYNYGEVVNDPDQPKAANSSKVSGPGLAQGPSQRQWLFTSVESLFLQAEAIQRGWLPGVALTAYQNAVRESFVWLGVPGGATAADTYLAQALPVVSWTLATTPDAKIKLIAMQRYLALTGVNNFEAWADYRRIGGVPFNLPLSLSPSRAGYTIPLRLEYPQNEYNYNAANVGAEGDINPQTSTIFWDR